MSIQADYLQVVGEVKERNRLFRALNEIRDIALLNCDEDMPIDVKKQFELIFQKCEDAMKPVTVTSKTKLRKIKSLTGE